MCSSLIITQPQLSIYSIHCHTLRPQQKRHGWLGRRRQASSAVSAVVLRSTSRWPDKSIALVRREGYHSVFTVSICAKEMAGRTDRCTGITWGAKLGVERDAEGVNPWDFFPQPQYNNRNLRRINRVTYEILIVSKIGTVLLSVTQTYPLVDEYPCFRECTASTSRTAASHVGEVTGYMKERGKETCHDEQGQSIRARYGEKGTMAHFNPELGAVCSPKM